MGRLGGYLLKGLSLLYLLMAIVGFLGYFRLENYSAAIFEFFYQIIGPYSLILPFICLTFTVICYQTSLPKENVDETTDVRTQQLSSHAHFKREMVSSKRNTKTTHEADRSSYDMYFNNQLNVKEPMEQRDLSHLGSDFSTYFGQGQKNIYLPNRTRDLHGFNEYFYNRNKQKSLRNIAVNEQASLEENIPCKEINPSLKTNPSKEIASSHRIENEQPFSGKIIDLVELKTEMNHPSKTISEKKWKLPDLSLLQKPIQNGNYTEKYEPKQLEETLNTFGVLAKVINITVGPVITRYELSPSPGTKISKIVSLSDDIALALASREIRIEAPIPGKAAVGIEVPRVHPQTVYIREIIDSEAFKKSNSRIRFALGKDISGVPVVAELEKMPHLLVAGATGSGKSIFINCFINSILYTADPSEVKFLMIDPKMVELSQYSKLPHLLTPVVTDPKKANHYLNYVVKEMENRYELFASQGVRDISHYNKMNQSNSLPLIIVIIDELADLMMVAANEIEDSICRLAQMARAAGIHLVIATQRPSVNVVTGLIKANIPSRISFAVSSQIDSRTILDTNGAEKLLGKGDMLYSPIGLNKPQRIHGCYIDEQETKEIINHWSSQASPTYLIDEEQLKKYHVSSKKEEHLDERFVEAGELIIASGIASVSFLQRRLRVGYSRAARLMDLLQENNIISGPDGNKPREILMSIEDFNENFSQ